MLNNAALDVVIGLVFIYLLYSLLGTVLQEIIATNIGLRSIILRMAIRRMLDDDGTEKGDYRLSKLFYDHPLIKSLRADTWFIKKAPSYLDKGSFSKVVTDLLRGKDVQPGDSSRNAVQQSLTDGKSAWNKAHAIKGDTLDYLKSIWADAHGDLDKFRELLESWFNEMMYRTTSWYKKYTQAILLVIGFGLAIGFNVDTFKIASKLQKNPKLREQLVAQANDYLKNHPDLDRELKAKEAAIDSLSRPASTKDSLKNNLEQTRVLRDSLVNQATRLVKEDISTVNNILGMGWPNNFLNPADCDGYSIVGWLITALAISLGAPFWFDMLNKLMKLRGSVEPKGSRQSKTSGDVPEKIIRVG